MSGQGNVAPPQAFQSGHLAAQAAVLPPMTLLEEFLLLALDNNSGQFYPLMRSTFDCATAGAVLMDLAERKRIDNDQHALFVIDPTPTGDPLLDGVLQIMAVEKTPKKVTHWLTQLDDEAGSMREKALLRLETRGILRREDKKILWVFDTTTYPMVDQHERNEVKLRIMGVVLRTDIPAPHDVVLVVLAQACGLFQHIMSSAELAAAQPRIDQVARMDLIGQAVMQAIAEIEAAVTMTSGFR